MNTKDLVAKVAKESSLNQKEARVIVNLVFDSIMEAVKDGERVQFPGFGSFYRKFRPARVYNGRFNKDGQATPEKYVPKFSAGKGFKDLVAK